MSKLIRKLIAILIPVVVGTILLLSVLSILWFWSLCWFGVEPGAVVVSVAGPFTYVYRPVISSDGELLAAFREDGLIVVSEWKSQRIIHTLSLAEAGFIGKIDRPPDGTLAISPGGSRIVFVGRKQAFVWRLPTGELLTTLRFPIGAQGYDEEIESLPNDIARLPLAWANESNLVFAKGGALFTWHTDKDVIRFLADLNEPIWVIKRVLQGQILIGTSGSIWELNSGTLKVSLKARVDYDGHRGAIHDISPDGKLAVSLASFREVRVFECDSGKPVWTRSLDDLFCHWVYFAQGGKLLICWSWRPRVVRVLHSQDGSHCCDKRNLALKFTFDAICWDGFLAVGSPYGRIYIYNTTTWLQPSE